MGARAKGVADARRMQTETQGSGCGDRVFLCFFALITEEGFLISPCYSLKLCIQMGISFLFSFVFHSYRDQDPALEVNTVGASAKMSLLTLSKDVSTALVWSSHSTSLVPTGHNQSLHIWGDF